MSSAYGKPIDLYECGMRNLNDGWALFLEFDGVVDGTTSIQYQILKSPGVVIIITGTCKNSVLDSNRTDLEDIVNSLRMNR